MSEKICRLWGELKPLGSFYRASGTRDGRRSECIACSRAQRAARYRNNPAARASAVARARAWQIANPERFRAQQLRAKESGAAQRAVRRSHLRRKYGLTIEQYEELFAAQHAGCAICGAAPASGQSLHVDHDHRSGAVRGLLCFNCNAGLGHFADDPAVLVRAAAYLAGRGRIAGVEDRR